MPKPLELTYHGITRSVGEWSDFLWIDYHTLHARIRRNWPPEKVIEEPVQHNGGGRRTHGATGTKEYVAWKGMIYRCENPTNNRWHRYGGRGITVCRKWRESFEAFLADVGPAPSPQHSLGRWDHDGNYEPGGNVAWQSPEQQAACWCRDNGSKEAPRTMETCR